MGSDIAKICGSQKRHLNQPSANPSLKNKNPSVSTQKENNILNPYINSVIKDKNVFEGIVATFHGQPKQQWVKIDEQYIYKGEWDGPNRHGQGLLYNKTQKYLICGCFYQNNLITHKCRKIYSDQVNYVGQLNDKYQMHGNGKVMGKKFTYQGQLKNNRFEGEGQLQIFQKINEKDTRQVSSFKGKFQRGRRKNGIQITKQGTYQGSYENDERQGLGVFNWTNGGKYEGQFIKNKMHGQGRLFDKEGNSVGKHTFQNGVLII